MRQYSRCLKIYWDFFTMLLGLYSLSGKTSYRQISWSLEATRLNVIIVVSLWNLTGTSAAALPMCLLNFREIGKAQTRISRLRDFTRSCSKTSYRLVNRGPGGWFGIKILSYRHKNPHYEDSTILWTCYFYIRNPLILKGNIYFKTKPSTWKNKSNANAENTR